MVHGQVFLKGRGWWWYFSYLIFQRFIIFALKLLYSLQYCLNKIVLCIWRKIIFFCHHNFMKNEPPYELWLNVYLILRFIYAQKPKVSRRRISCPSRIASPNIKKGLSRRKYGFTKSTSTSNVMGIGCLFPKQCRVSHNAANWTFSFK